MANPYDNLTLPALRSKVSGATSYPFYRTNLAYDGGDHWQLGTAWIGPMPSTRDPEAAAIIAEIQRAFTSQNAIAEIVTRHCDGIIGREPDWSLTPRRRLKKGKKATRAEQALIDEAEDALVEWWDDREMHGTLRKAARTLLLGESVMLRLSVRSDEGGLLPLGGTLAQALDRIYVDVIAPDQGGLIEDGATRSTCAVATLHLETVGGAASNVIEASYLDGDLTILRVAIDGRESAVAFPLGRHLTMHQVRLGKPFISAQIRQLQNLLNLAVTMLGRNVIQGGFLERTLLNAAMPGGYVDDPDNLDEDGNPKKKWVAEPFRTGAGRTNFISGQPIFDDNGKITGYTNASITYRDPVAITTFEGTKAACYAAILTEAQQAHALIAGDATVSAVSRVQARADFASSLHSTKESLDSLIRWLLETVLALGATITGQPGRFEGLRAVSDCRIDTGPLTPEEQGVIITRYEKKLLSQEMAMSLLGVEDVDAEIARIKAAQAEAQQQAMQIAQAEQPAQGATGDTTQAQAQAQPQPQPQPQGQQPQSPSAPTATPKGASA